LAHLSRHSEGLSANDDDRNNNRHDTGDDRDALVARDLFGGCTEINAS
jgi:hypothetical protein